MSTVFEIPLSAVPQTQIISLGSVQYQVTTRWNAFSESWVMDIADANENKLLSGIPLVTGLDLLEQFAYLGLAGGGALVVQSDNDPALVPDVASLGITGHLFYIAP